MPSLFHLVFLVCFLLTDSNITQSFVHFFTGSMGFIESLQFIQMANFNQLMTTFAEKMFIFAGIFILMILYRSKLGLSKQLCMWFSLLVTCGYYWTTMWGFWLPFTAGDRINSTYMVDLIFIPIIALNLGVFAGLLGYSLGNYIDKRNRLNA